MGNHNSLKRLRTWHHGDDTQPRAADIFITRAEHELPAFGSQILEIERSALVKTKTPWVLRNLKLSFLSEPNCGTSCTGHVYLIDSHNRILPCRHVIDLEGFHIVFSGSLFLTENDAVDIEAENNENTHEVKVSGRKPMYKLVNQGSIPLKYNISLV